MPSTSPHRPEHWEAFLDALRESPLVTAACARSGIPRSTAYDRRDADPVFRKRWDDAVEEARDRVRGMLLRGALGQPMMVGSPTPSERMQIENWKMYCLCALPELRQRSTDLTSGGRPLGATPAYDIDFDALTPEQRRRLIAGEPVANVLNGRLRAALPAEATATDASDDEAEADA